MQGRGDHGACSMQAGPVRPRTERKQGRASCAHLPRFLCCRGRRQSGMPRVEVLQQLRQGLGIFFIDHMAGMCDGLQLRARDVLSQEPGG